MKEYHKIQTVFKRDAETKFKTLLIGEYALPEFEYLANNEWIFTEKVDGTNIRVMWFPSLYQITFMGKTDRAQIYGPLVTRLEELFHNNKIPQLFPDVPVCLYGEGYGARIQKGGGNYISDGVDFVLFDVKIDEWWLQREDVEDIGNKLGIRVVPDIGWGTLHDMVRMVENGFKSQWGDFMAEGIVARPRVELKSRNGHRVITKIKHKDFRR